MTIDRRHALWWLVGSLLAPAALAGETTTTLVPPTPKVRLAMRNEAAGKLISDALSEPEFWTEAWSRTYDEEVYDTIRMRPQDDGYVPLITGEGGQNFAHDTVVKTVWEHMTDLPKHMEGSKVVLLLGSGNDPTIGSEYRDLFFFMDLTLFYIRFPKRLYRRHDDTTGRTYLWFEKLVPSMAGEGTWADYERRMKEASDSVQLRWPPFNGVIDVTDVYGTFVVEPGTTFASRVTLISRLVFGENTGRLAQWGSQVPGVIRAGLISGFGAACAIARDVQGQGP